VAATEFTRLIMQPLNPQPLGFDRVTLPKGLASEPLAPITLRGKGEAVPVVALHAA